MLDVVNCNTPLAVYESDPSYVPGFFTNRIGIGTGDDSTGLVHEADPGIKRIRLLNVLELLAPVFLRCLVSRFRENTLDNLHISVTLNEQEIDLFCNLHGRPLEIPSRPIDQIPLKLRNAKEHDAARN